MSERIQTIKQVPVTTNLKCFSLTAEPPMDNDVQYDSDAVTASLHIL